MKLAKIISLLGETRAEKLIRDSERLEAAKDYVKAQQYLNKNELLIILGETPEKEEK